MVGRSVGRSAVGRSVGRSVPVGRSRSVGPGRGPDRSVPVGRSVLVGRSRSRSLVGRVRSVGRSVSR